MAYPMIVVASPSGNAVPEPAEERPLTAALEPLSGASMRYSPSLYDLPNDAPLFTDLARWPHDVIIVSPLAPRAVYWLLRARGVMGTFRTMAGQIEVDTGEASPGEPPTARNIWCIHRGRHVTAEQIAEQVRQIAGRTSDEQFEADAQTARSAATQSTPVGANGTRPVERWYPVLDMDSCVDCYECLNFCLFGVYDLDAHSRIFVAMPDECRTGCPACSRICPTGAIFFPKHRDPMVAGLVDRGSSTTADNASSPATGSPAAHEAERERNRAMEEAEENASDQTDEQRRDGQDEWITPISDVERWVREVDDFDV